MYSFFDTFNLRAQLAAEKAPEDDYLVHFDPQDKRLARMLMDSHKLVGWASSRSGADRLRADHYDHAGAGRCDPVALGPG